MPLNFLYSLYFLIKLLCPNDAEKEKWMKFFLEIKQKFIRIVTSRQLHYDPQKAKPLYMPKSFTKQCMLRKCGRKFGFTGTKYHCSKNEHNQFVE